MIRRHDFPVMGTQASLAARCPAASFADLTAITQSVLHDADARFSPYRADSELSALRRDPDHEPSADMRRVHDGCRLMATLTDDAFCAIDRRGRYDPIGFVKGWAMHQVEQRAVAAGIDDWLLNVGGDIVARGRNGERPWHVALRHPDDALRVVEVIPLSDAALATSGDYARGSHVWNRDRQPVHRRGSVTVVGPRIDIADALATAAWAQGGAEPSWLERLPDYTVLFVSPAGVVTSQGFPLVA